MEIDCLRLDGCLKSLATDDESIRLISGECSIEEKVYENRKF